MIKIKEIYAYVSESQSSVKHLEQQLNELDAERIISVSYMYEDKFRVIYEYNH